jgi:hypothetical protein
MSKRFLKIVNVPRIECEHINCNDAAIFVVVTDRIRGRYCASCTIQQLRRMATGTCATVTRLLVSERTSP